MPIETSIETALLFKEGDAVELEPAGNDADPRHLGLGHSPTIVLAAAMHPRLGDVTRVSLYPLGIAVRARWRDLEGEGG
jgi:hypothetical protein